MIITAALDLHEANWKREVEVYIAADMFVTKKLSGGLTEGQMYI